MARRISSTMVDPQGLSAFTACRLIALDKNPGVRPIGICETARRIISKAILHIIRGNIQQVAGSTQLCAGQIAGIEAAIHATRLTFSADTTEGALLVDASNAFNSLNRQVALHNIERLCPALSTVLTNTYRDPAHLFVDGNVLLSQEGTTQGDPLAMPMYAIAILPLTQQVNQSVTQVWYADDATATGCLPALRDWWDKLVTLGPTYGYHVNATKTWLISKEHCYTEASNLFEDTQVNVTSEGRPHLGAAIGTESYINSYVKQKVEQWSVELERLALVATTQPHSAFAAFTHGFTSKWTHLARTIPNISHLLQPLEDIISTRLIPALSGRQAPNNLERNLLSLPARLGGIGLTNPTEVSTSEFAASQDITQPLSDLIAHQISSYPPAVMNKQLTIKANVKKAKRQHLSLLAANLKPNLSAPLQRAMGLAQERGASSWLTTRPIEEHGFALHKGAFRDALALRYGWQPSHTPTTCVCGHSFSLDHVLSCPRGGFPSIRHNEV